MEAKKLLNEQAIAESKVMKGRIRSADFTTEGEKFTIKKVILTDNNTYEPMRAYVKTASGVKGWIFIDPTTDEYGNPMNPVVK